MMTNSKEVSVEEIMNLGDRSIGLKVYIKSLGSDYVGIIQNVLPNNSRRIGIMQVVNPNNGRKYLGGLSLLGNLVSYICVLGVDEEVRKTLMKTRSTISTQKRILHLSKNDASDEHIGLFDIVRRKEEDMDDIKNQKDLEVPTPPLAYRFGRPSGYSVVKDETELQKVLIHLVKEPVLTLYAAGHSLGRKGSLAWLCLATLRHAFLIDMATLTPTKVLNSGIADIMRDHDQLKIMHDSRPLNDYLMHCHRLEFNNVDNCVVLDFALQKRSKKQCLAITNSLTKLLTTHLNCSHNCIPYIKNQEDETVWFERPLDSSLILCLFQNIQFLHELHYTLMQKLNHELHQINHHFSHLITNLDDIGAFMSDTNIIPSTIVQMIN